MNTIIARAIAPLVIALLGLGALAAPVPTAQAAELAPQPAMKSSPGTWKCGKWKSNPSTSKRVCAKITSFNQTFDVDYTRTFFNKFKKKKITVQCTTSKSTTWKFGVSASVEAEAGVIFAKAKTSLTGSVERSATTTDTASATFKLKPRKYANCKRGMYEYKWRGVVRTQLCGSSGCRVYKDKYRAHAPSRDAFFIGPGRG